MGADSGPKPDGNGDRDSTSLAPHIGVISTGEYKTTLFLAFLGLRPLRIVDGYRR